MVIYYAFEHLPDRLKEPDAVVIPATLWSEDDYDPKELARDGAVVPGRLDQLDEKAPMVTIAGSAA